MQAIACVLSSARALRPCSYDVMHFLVRYSPLTDSRGVALVIFGRPSHF